nr:hypothetical protein [Natronohydrobacter thiooxidans]
MISHRHRSLCFALPAPGMSLARITSVWDLLRRAAQVNSDRLDGQTVFSQRTRARELNLKPLRPVGKQAQVKPTPIAKPLLVYTETGGFDLLYCQWHRSVLLCYRDAARYQTA